MNQEIRASRIYTRKELCLMEQVPQPCAVVIFGASGDLAWRKLFPSLFHLHLQDLLPSSMKVVGVGRSPIDDLTFRLKVEDALSDRGSPEERRAFSEKCSFISGSYNEPDTYRRLKNELDGFQVAGEVVGRYLFYLSVPPAIYPTIMEQLAFAGLGGRRSSAEWSRVIVEKPFGTDLASARALNKVIHRFFREEQVYRIDHYLGKETVQNILIFRFANTMFEPSWNRNYIDNIQITAAESLGVGHRAGYYESSGVVRDMFQNHLFQLLALIAMDPPARFDAESVRDKRAEVFKALRPVTDPDSVFVQGQYTSSPTPEGPLPGYREEDGVAPDSGTPTFAALKLELDNWRWQGVPFYLRSGKRMAERVTEIAVQFKPVPTSIFKPLLTEHLSPNLLRFRIQPDERISVSFEAKHPGPKLCLSTVTMDFGYQKTFGVSPPEAYARLFLDALLGDQTLFARSDGVEEAWKILDPLLQAEARGLLPLHPYPAGTWGPAAAEELLVKDGRSWSLPMESADD